MKILPVRLPAKAATRTIRPLIIFPLMPQKPANTMRQSGRAHTPQQSSINTGHIGRIALRPLMLINARPPHRTIQNAHRNHLGINQPPAQLHPPIPNFRQSIRTAGHRLRPRPPTGRFRIAGSRAKRPHPSMRRRSGRITPVGGHRIRLAIDDKSISAHQVIHRLQQAAIHPPFRSIRDQSRLHWHRKSKLSIRCNFAFLLDHQRLAGKDLEKNRLTWAGQRPVPHQGAVTAVIAGIKLTIDRSFIRSRHGDYPWIARWLRDFDGDRASSGRAAVARRQRHRHHAAAHGPDQRQSFSLRLLDDRRTRHLPLELHGSSARRRRLTDLTHDRLQRKRRASIPLRRRAQRKDRLRNSLANRQGNRQHSHSLRIKRPHF